MLLCRLEPLNSLKNDPCPNMIYSLQSTSQYNQHSSGRRETYWSGHSLTYSDYSRTDIITVSLELLMKIAVCKLPPLPKKYGDLQPPVLQCQSISLQRKYLAVQAELHQNDEDFQLLQQKLTLITSESRRPSSNKSQNSLESRNKSNESRYAQRTTSHESKKSIVLSEFPPKVTAKSWVIYDMLQGRALWTHRSHKRREMASLTKMMNLITILELTAALSIDPHDIRVKASRTSCSITGTTAQLRPGADYSLYDLLFGMMLPSGNDAAWLIAEVGGFLLKAQSDSNYVSVREVNSKINSDIAAFSQQLVTSFIKEMNRLARKIDMNSSNFANPHGLSNTNNYSNAEDLAKLCSYAMRNPSFRRIVQTRKHTYCLLADDKEEAETIASNQTIEEEKENSAPNLGTSLARSSLLEWENTNRLLGEGWSGIKTGITPNAGPCLAASLCRTLEGKRFQFLVILLSSESMEARWKQARELVEWAIQNRRYV